MYQQVATIDDQQVDLISFHSPPLPLAPNLNHLQHSGKDDSLLKKSFRPELDVLESRSRFPEVKRNLSLPYAGRLSRHRCSTNPHLFEPTQPLLKTSNAFELPPTRMKPLPPPLPPRRKTVSCYRSSTLSSSSSGLSSSSCSSSSSSSSLSTSPPPSYLSSDSKASPKSHLIQTSLPSTHNPQNAPATCPPQFFESIQTLWKSIVFSTYQAAPGRRKSYHAQRCKELQLGSTLIVRSVWLRSGLSLEQLSSIWEEVTKDRRPEVLGMVGFNSFLRGMIKIDEARRQPRNQFWMNRQKDPK